MAPVCAFISLDKRGPRGLTYRTPQIRVVGQLSDTRQGLFLGFDDEPVPAMFDQLRHPHPLPEQHNRQAHRHGFQDDRPAGFIQMRVDAVDEAIQPVEEFDYTVLRFRLNRNAVTQTITLQRLGQASSACNHDLVAKTRQTSKE